MTAFSGRRISIGLGLQTKEGAQADPSYWFSTTDRSFSRGIEKITNESSIGSRYKLQSHKIVRDHGTGNFVGLVNPDNIPVLLTAILGGGISSSKAGSASTLVGTHVIKNADSTQTPTFSTWLQTPPYNEQFVDCRAGSLNFTANANDFLMYTFEFMGKTPKTVETAKTVSYNEPEQFASGNIEMKNGATLTAITDSTAPLKTKSMNFTIDGDLEGYGTLTSTDYETFVAKTLGCTGQFTILFEDTTIRNIWVKNNVIALKLTATSDLKIGTTSTPFSVEFDFAKVRLTNVTENRGTDDIQELAVDFAVEANEGTNLQSIQVTVKNNKESYA